MSDDAGAKQQKEQNLTESEISQTPGGTLSEKDLSQTVGGGTDTHTILGGIKGESMDDKHKDEIEIANL